VKKPKRKRVNPAPNKKMASDKAVQHPAGGADNSGGAMLGAAGLAEVRQLIRVMQRTGIGELEISSGGRTVRIAAQAPQGMAAGLPVSVLSAPAAAPVMAAPAVSPSASAAMPAAASPAENLAVIASPMVGTFYRAPAPDADPYVEVGDMVEVGQTVCIVEAMKLMNEIESEHRGRVVKILAENAQPVEFGQKLFLIEPA
jgi:acetyl-CoA carboxylase biotin carboxyl carrier protein